MATNLHNGQSAAKSAAKPNRTHTQGAKITKPVAMPALTVLEQQLDAQDEALNANAADLIHAKMEQMKGNLQNTVVDTLSEYAEMSDFFDLGAMFNQAPLLEESTDSQIDPSQEAIEVHAEST
jgi:hypothetical protein